MTDDMAAATAFAEARLAEDKGLAGRGWSPAITAGEAEAGIDGRSGQKLYAPIRGYAWTPDRMCREVEAGYRILERHRDCEPYGGGLCDHAGIVKFDGRPCPDMRDLLSRWADHTDFQQGWRP